MYFTICIQQLIAEEEEIFDEVDKKKKFFFLVLLTTPYCALLAYLVRSCCVGILDFWGTRNVIRL